MITSKRVVVPNRAACLRTIPYTVSNVALLIVVELLVGKVSEVTVVFLDVQDVRVEVHVLVAEGV